MQTNILLLCKDLNHELNESQCVQTVSKQNVRNSAALDMLSVFFSPSFKTLVLSLNTLSFVIKYLN